MDVTEAERRAVRHDVGEVCQCDYSGNVFFIKGTEMAYHKNRADK